MDHADGTSGPLHLRPWRAGDVPAGTPGAGGQSGQHGGAERPGGVPGRTGVWAVLDGPSGAVVTAVTVRDGGDLPAYDGVTDGTVAVRRWRLQDAEQVARACSDPQIARWLHVPVPYDLAAATDFVDRHAPAAWAAGTPAELAVVDPRSDEVLGAVGLTRRDGIGEVGYWTAPWARGRGVATRACVLQTGWAFEALGLPRVELLADVDNLASQRVAERAGFTREGVARAARPAVRAPGRTDMVVFARLPADPPPHR